MSDFVNELVVGAALTFGMAHPVAAASIAIAGIVVYGAVKISNNNSNNKNDEDSQFYYQLV